MSRRTEAAAYAAHLSERREHHDPPRLTDIDAIVHLAWKRMGVHAHFERHLISFGIGHLFGTATEK